MRVGQWFCESISHWVGQWVGRGSVSECKSVVCQWVCQWVSVSVSQWEIEWSSEWWKCHSAQCDSRSSLLLWPALPERGLQGGGVDWVTVQQWQFWNSKSNLSYMYCILTAVRYCVIVLCTTAAIPDTGRREHRSSRRSSSSSRRRSSSRRAGWQGLGAAPSAGSASADGAVLTHEWPVAGEDQGQEWAPAAEISSEACGHLVSVAVCICSGSCYGRCCMSYLSGRSCSCYYSCYCYV